MNPLIVPASPPRRLAAACYDALLLAGLWMAVTLAYVLGRDALGAGESPALLRALFLLAGLGFFGASWTRVGATPGMRAWRLALRRDDGLRPRWPEASLRYGLMLIVWSVFIAPMALLALPARMAPAHRAELAAGAATVALACLVSQLFDGRRRSPHDRLSGTEMVLMPATQRSSR